MSMHLSESEECGNLIEWSAAALHSIHFRSIASSAYYLPRGGARLAPRGGKKYTLVTFCISTVLHRPDVPATRRKEEGVGRRRLKRSVGLSASKTDLRRTCFNPRWLHHSESDGSTFEDLRPILQPVDVWAHCSRVQVGRACLMRCISYAREVTAANRQTLVDCVPQIWNEWN